MKTTAVLLSLALVGCATKQYFHTAITDPAQIEQQRVLDDAYCTEAAMGSVPMPQVAYSPSTPETYRSSGTVTGYSPQTGYTNYSYSGTSRSVSSPGASFSQGFANGVNIGNAIAARQAQDKIHHACMVAKGWSEDKDAAIALATKRSARQAATDKWADTIDQFYKTEASRPDGIDYRGNSLKTMQLDTVVKQLANDPKNNDKTMLWFLVEADRIVKNDYSPERSVLKKTD